MSPATVGSRAELMRDAIIYNKNNPSILFYECGDSRITKDQMIQMKGIRDQYDPFGGRGSAAASMMGSTNAEYGGEMLYVDKSATETDVDDGVLARRGFAEALGQSLAALSCGRRRLILRRNREPHALQSQ